MLLIQDQIHNPHQLANVFHLQLLWQAHRIDYLKYYLHGPLSKQNEVENPFLYDGIVTKGLYFFCLL